MDSKVVPAPSGALQFVVADPLEEYRVQSMLTKEPETIQWIDHWAAGEPKTFWDIGSNIGIYTLYAAAKSPALRVLSIEPFFRNFVDLKANIHLNRLGNVTPLWLALNNSSGIATFGIQDERNGASGNVVVSAAEAGHFKATETLLQVRGDDLLSLGAGAPAFVKIDVDGIELEIVEGMTAVLANATLQSVLVEINSKSCLDAISALFRTHGLVPDDRFNSLENHSRNRRQRDARNTAENWIFTKR